jgi:Membrane-associated phospholipid phosphatase
MNEHASPAFDSFFVAFTELGGLIVVPIVTFALFVYLLIKKQYPKALLVSVGVGGAAAIAYILKSVFDRPRPDLWEWLIVETQFSFPSGHAVASSALAFCVVILVWRTKWRTLAIVLGGIYVLAIGVSRLYLGVHYPTDILGGWLLSTAWVALVTSVIYLYVLDNRKKSRILFWK